LIEFAGSAVLMSLLLVAVITDIRARIIRNTLVVTGMLAGLLISGLVPQGLGFFGALGGIAVGLACFLPLYALGAMGAGDVKLMAMAGAFLGPGATFEAVLWVMVAGGMLALLFAVRQGVVRKMLGNIAALFYSATAALSTRSVPDLSGTPPSGKLPYAVAIAVGVGMFLLARAAGFNLL
jgi:prepilin peptidase CpaA